MSAPLTNTHRENDLEAFFRKRVRALGGYTEKIIGMSKGTPDRLVLMPGGKIYIVELKTEEGSVDPLQKVWHTRAANLGTRVWVLHGREGVIKWLRHVVSSYSTAPKAPKPRKNKRQAVDLSEKSA